MIEGAAMKRTTKYKIGCVGAFLWVTCIGLPAVAQTNQSDITGGNTFSDITGANIFNFSDITGTNIFGNRLPPDSEVSETTTGSSFAAINNALQLAIAALISNAGISAETQESLRQAEACLAELSQQNGKCIRGLDRTFQQIARNLSNDINALNQACNAGNQAACTRLGELVVQTDQFLDRLESFRTTLIERAQVSRTF
jgi:hypothetical protein